jgi:hypothetical protein
MLRELVKIGTLFCFIAAGLGIGYVVYILFLIVMWVIYGDNGSGPGRLVTNSVFYGVFGFFSIGGFFVGLKVIPNLFRSKR